MRSLTFSKYKVQSQFLKLEFLWGMQQPISAAGTGMFLSSSIQCCHFLPLIHGESGLNHFTRLQDTLGNTSEFGSVPRGPTEIS